MFSCLMIQTFLVRTHCKNCLPKKNQGVNIFQNSGTFPGLFKIINKSKDIPGFPEPAGTLLISTSNQATVHDT